MLKKLLFLFLLIGCSSESSNDEKKIISLDLNKTNIGVSDSIIIATLSNTSESSIFVLTCPDQLLYRHIDRWDLVDGDSNWVDYYGNTCNNVLNYDYIEANSKRPFTDTVNIEGFVNGKYRYAIVWVDNKESELKYGSVKEFYINREI